MHSIKSFLIVFLMSIHATYAQEQSPLSDRYATEFEAILASQELQGTILVFHAKRDSFYSNDFRRARQGFLPASTFKIPNTLIALETGIVKDEKSMLLWDGKKRNNPNWEKDLTLKDAFRLSCVPCYQEIAGKIGLPRMLSYLNRFSYPSIAINEENLQIFWLVGDAKISAFQQIQFLRDFYNRKIKLSDHSYTTMLQILEIERDSHYSLSGKTGWSTDHGDNGWFVGYLRRGEDIYYFATNLTPKNPVAIDEFLTAREQVVRQALRAMRALQ